MPETMKIDGGCKHGSCGQPLGKVVERETKRGTRAALVCLECGTFTRWVSTEKLTTKSLPEPEPESVEDDDTDLETAALDEETARIPKSMTDVADDESDEDEE